MSRNTSSVSSGHDLLSTRGSHRHEEWNTDLLGCCSEPSLCKEASLMTSFHILCVAAVPLFKNGEKLNYAGFLMSVGPGHVLERAIPPISFSLVLKEGIKNTYCVIGVDGLFTFPPESCQVQSLRKNQVSDARLIFFNSLLI
ncbi:PLAC8 family protein [Prunus dulcis]|uniref:PLAC8 family protein n=1 Tax=Prunus dulcis TaxID=3755 RepID=A0A4Y1RUK3_PRUDU|nr:PLAC8 family protein [Prunus dulcis]